MIKIVTIGGGTGSYAVLSGLKGTPKVSLTALVSMADDGGSTGMLRKNWHVRPPGDVRQCLAALSGKDFLNKRIGRHKVGNLVLAVLEKITGDFNRALRVASLIFRAKGEIIPITLEDAVLKITLKNGRQIVGENKIDNLYLQSEGLEDLVESVSYIDNTALAPKAREAIIAADFIIVGPGNIFCSILPNFATSGFEEAIGESNAKIIFIMNLVNKPGHTLGWGAQNYISIVEKYLGKKIDIVLANKKKFSAEQHDHYLEDADEKIFLQKSVRDKRIVWTDLLVDKLLTQNKSDPVRRSLIRHDPEKLAIEIGKIISKYLIT